MYIDAVYNRNTDTIYVVERHEHGREYKEYPAEYVVYYEDRMGEYNSLYGTSLRKYSTNSHKEFQKELKLFRNKRLFESDINPIFRCLMENYKTPRLPNLHIGYFDIEVEFDPKRDYAPVDDPFARINALSVYLDWVDQNVTLSLYPSHLSREEAEALVEGIEDLILFDTEEELLEAFLEIIEDTDILTGWNSTLFDIPYIVGRIERVLSKDHTRKLCLWDMLPKKRKFKKFNKEYTTYDLIGRIHVDYLDLYRKHNPQQLHTYKLDYVGELEVGENKIPYDGSLDKLFKEDFRKFVLYNKQDTTILMKIDRQRKYLELVNGLSHYNTVLIPTTMGSVALIEQALINEAHDMGMMVPDRIRATAEEVSEDDGDDDEDDNDGVAGAYVTDPKKGLRKWVASVDINSLYPSALRSLNMSTETVVGQIRQTLTEEYLQDRIKNQGMSATEAMHGMFGSVEYQEIMKRSNKLLTIDFEDRGKSVTFPAFEVYDMLFNKMNLTLSANGTIFRKDKEGVIPHILKRWYNERKEMQGRAKTYGKLATEGIEVPNDLLDMLK